MTPRYHATPPEAVTEVVRETVFVGGHTFRIDHPIDTDKLLDHPWVRSAYAADEYVPYWAQLWPSAGLERRLRKRSDGIPAPRRRCRSTCPTASASSGACP